MVGYSLEAERAARMAARNERIDGAAVSVELSTSAFTDAIGELQGALDSKGMSLALQKAVAIKVAEMARDGKVSGGDMIRLFGMLNDRADGKVKESLEVSGNISFGAILREISGTSAGLPDYEAEIEELRQLDIIDAAVVE